MDGGFLVLDFGSQYTQLIARRLRELNVYSEIVLYDTPIEEIRSRKPDGIILSGGPSSVSGAESPTVAVKELMEIAPVLGICYGMQLINVLEGGTLHQHIHPPKKGYNVDHEGKKNGLHPVRVIQGTRLAKILGKGRKIVATQHHQGVRTLAPDFIPAAIASDGLIEAMEHPKYPQIFTIQWHPERQLRSQTTQRLLRAFVRSCQHYQRRRNS